MAGAVLRTRVGGRAQRDHLASRFSFRAPAPAPRRALSKLDESEAFDAVGYAQRELAPLLRQLCDLAEAEGEPRQRDFFGRVLRGIELARAAEDLADPFMALSTAAFAGFGYSAPVTFLLDDVLARAHNLAESLSLEPRDVH